MKNKDSKYAKTIYNQCLKMKDEFIEHGATPDLI
jgi:hypothetical protein